MSSVPCTSCGAEILPGTKFCRRCGQPSLDAASVSEASTRVFGATAERTQPTQTWNAQPTGPAYVAPAGASPLQDVTTKSLESSAGQKQKIWLAASVIALLLLVFVAVGIGIILKARSAHPVQTTPVVVVPETGLPPLPPMPPPPPPVEPPAPGKSVSTSELMYPGAETVMDMKTGRDNLLELRTSDPLEKVVDWYMTKLKPAEIIRTPGKEAILRAGKTSIIISNRGSGTDILIKQGVER